MNLVERFAEAFNRCDVDGLLACFTEDATYRDLFYGPHEGQAALRGMFERMFREGRHVLFSGMSAFYLDGGDLEGGRIRAYREHADTGVALLQLGFSPESLAKVLSRRLPTA